jgi:hypothetical protein
MARMQGVAGELDLMRHLLLALGRRPDVRLWRQNVGRIPVRDAQGRVLRVFSTGTPRGAADLTGYVRPEGWRLEIEVKGPGGVLRPEQATFARLVTLGGCVYALVTYDPARSPAENVAAGVRQVEAAIAARRSRDAVVGGGR